MSRILCLTLSFNVALYRLIISSYLVNEPHWLEFCKKNQLFSESRIRILVSLRTECVCVRERESVCEQERVCVRESLGYGRERVCVCERENANCSHRKKFRLLLFMNVWEMGKPCLACSDAHKVTLLSEC